MADDEQDRTGWRDEKGRFALGNRWWEARSSHGRRPLFETPEQLLAACMEYIEWTEANPLWEARVFQHQGAIVEATLPKMRAMTIGGLCIFLDIPRQTWIDYRSRPDFTDICAQVEEMIRAQKFTGAAADLLNASIIARDLGLADKQEHTGKDGGPIEVKRIERHIVDAED